jgi:hypothetical protein
MNRHSFNVEALKCTLPHALQNVSKRAAAARHIPLPHPTNLGSECRETRHQHAMLVILVLHPAIAVHQIVGVIAYITSVSSSRSSTNIINRRRRRLNFGSLPPPKQMTEKQLSRIDQV